MSKLKPEVSGKRVICYQKHLAEEQEQEQKQEQEQEQEQKQKQKQKEEQEEKEEEGRKSHFCRPMFT